MKKIIGLVSIFVLMLVCIPTQAQTTKDTLIYEYAELTSIPIFGDLIHIQGYLDKGINCVGKTSVIKKNLIISEDGKKIKFNSHIEILNFLSKDRWELMTVYVVENHSTNLDNIYYLLRRKKINN